MNSPDLNPVEYKVLGVMQECIYCTSVVDIVDLKWCLIVTWSGLQQHVIDEAIAQWVGRLHACARTDGRHFKHVL